MSDYLDVDGAYTAVRYAPGWEQSERRRWERLTGLPWDRPAAEVMEDEAYGVVSTNKGAGPGWDDLCRACYFEETR